MKRSVLTTVLVAAVASSAALVARADRPAPPRHVVKAADVAPFAPKGGKLEARVLVDADSVGATQASLTLLTLKMNTQIPLHRQTSAKVIYVLDGYARITALVGYGKGDVDVGPGDAIYVPANVPVGMLAKCCKLMPTKFLVLYAPGGPEHPYRDPASAKAGGWTTPITAAEAKKPPEDAPRPRIVHGKDVADLDIAGGKGKVKILFDAEGAGDPHAYVGLLTAQAGMTVPEHAHDKEDEILWIVSGKGDMTLDGQAQPVEAGEAIHIPAGAKHSFKSDAGLTAVQFYTPSGPEQRFKKAAVPK